MSISLKTCNELHYHFLFLFSLSILIANDLPLVSAISFNYPDFSNNSQNLNITLDASVFGKALSLTTNRVDSVGRVVYYKELHLWDNATGRVADFVTHFSFNISMVDGGHGFAFFLAPNGSHVPENSWGGCLALISNCSDFNTTGKAIVAVEFDTYKNEEWDPSDNHVGINVNSIFSVANITWSRNVKNGSKANAWITYNSRTKNLSLFLTYDDNAIFNGNSSLSYEINLPKVLPEFVTVGFSSSTGYTTEMHNNILSWDFNSTEINSTEINSTNISPIPDADIGGGASGKKNNTGLIVGCVIGGLVAVGVLISLLVFYKRRISPTFSRPPSSGGFAMEPPATLSGTTAHLPTPRFDNESMDHEFQHATGPKSFSYKELVRATNNFAEEGKLGRGGFGEVYRGNLSGKYVAVKRVSNDSNQGRKEYMSEVIIISKLRQKNLVKLMGWCHEKGEFLLIYEYMPNGSLDSHLFREDNKLAWGERHKIAIGLASAVLYLHEEAEQCVVHRDIKSSNVMLDSDFNAKLGDFGLARLADHGKGPETTILAGTLGYMAPECVFTGKASKESDVYSYGVVALEIACGRKPINHKAREDQIYMIQWVWDLYGGGNLKLLEAADPRLNGDFDEQQMERLLIVGLWCVYPDPNLRPSIRQAIQVLNFEAPMPVLPSKMPVPTYFPPSTPLSSLSLSLEVTGSQNQSSSYSYGTDFSQVTSSSSVASTSALLMHK